MSHRKRGRAPQSSTMRKRKSRKRAGVRARERSQQSKYASKPHVRKSATARKRLWRMNKQAPAYVKACLSDLTFACKQQVLADERVAAAAQAAAAERLEAERVARDDERVAAAAQAAAAERLEAERVARERALVQRITQRTTEYAATMRLEHQARQRAEVQRRSQFLRIVRERDSAHRKHQQTLRATNRALPHRPRRRAPRLTNKQYEWLYPQQNELHDAAQHEVEKPHIVLPVLAPQIIAPASPQALREIVRETLQSLCERCEVRETLQSLCERCEQAFEYDAKREREEVNESDVHLALLNPTHPSMPPMMRPTSATLSRVGLRVYGISAGDSWENAHSAEPCPERLSEISRCARDIHATLNRNSTLQHWAKAQCESGSA